MHTIGGLLNKASHVEARNDGLLPLRVARPAIVPVRHIYKQVGVRELVQASSSSPLLALYLHTRFRPTVRTSGSKAQQEPVAALISLEHFPVKTIGIVASSIVHNLDPPPPCFSLRSLL